MLLTQVKSNAKFGRFRLAAEASSNVSYGQEADTGATSGYLLKMARLGGLSVARYFFHVVEDNYKVDIIGADYPDAEIARMEAVRFAGEMLKNEPERVWKGAELRIEATDIWGTILFTLIIAGVDAEALARHRD